MAPTSNGWPAKAAPFEGLDDGPDGVVSTEVTIEPEFIRPVGPVTFEQVRLRLSSYPLPPLHGRQAPDDPGPSR